jgi:hypothetical protein
MTPYEQGYYDTLEKLGRYVQHIDETTGEEFTVDQPSSLPVKNTIEIPIGMLAGAIGGSFLGGRLMRNRSLGAQLFGSGAGGILGAVGGTGLGSMLSERRWANTPGHQEAEAYARMLQERRRRY